MIPYNKEEVQKFIQTTSECTAVYVGCDSRRFRYMNRWFASYTTVVVIHLDQCRGCAIYGKRNVIPDHGSVKERMLHEVNFAIEIAQDVAEVVGNRKFEIHLDVNPDPKHKSNVAVKEALGYVQGMGFIGKIKPHAPIASTAADFFGKAKVSVPKQYLMQPKLTQ